MTDCTHGSARLKRRDDDKQCECDLNSTSSKLIGSNARTQVKIRVDYLMYKFSLHTQRFEVPAGRGKYTFTSGRHWNHNMLKKLVNNEWQIVPMDLPS